MKKILLLIVLAACWSCTEYDVDGQELPSLTGMTAQNMNTTLPIVDIQADPEEFDFMYSNFRDDTIIPATISFYDPNGQQRIQNSIAYLEIKGAASATNAMKSIGITLETPTDNNANEVLRPSSVLPNHHLDELKTFRLRNSGNDFGFSMVKDMCYTRMAINAGADLELMYGQPVHAFVNNEYFGLLNLRTESNANGISRLMNVSTERVTLLKVDVDNGKLEYREGDESRADLLLQAIKDKDTDALWDLIDVDNYIDYIVFQDYIGNRDWPENNMRAYCIDQGKFRFFLYDLDFASFHNKNDIIPTFEFKDHQMAKIYRTLREHSEFEDKFNARQKSLYERMNFSMFANIMDDLVDEINDEMPYLMARYGVPQSNFHWKINLSNVRRDFEKRDGYIRDKYDL